MQTFDCTTTKQRSTKSLLECSDDPYIKYDVTHVSQIWSLASRAGSVRQEVKYERNKAYPPISFTGWDETEFDKLETEQEWTVKHVYIELKSQETFLFQKVKTGIKMYSLHSRVPTRLPIIDVKAKRPKPNGSVTITLDDVCFC